MISSFYNSPNDKQHLPALLELLRIVDAFEPYQIDASKRMLNMSILNQGDISRASYKVAIERIQSIGSIVEVLSRDEELADLYNKATNPVYYLQLEQARLGADVDMAKINLQLEVDKANINLQLEQARLGAGVDKAKINAAVQTHESDNKAGVDKTKINANAVVQAGVDKAKISATVQMHESDNKAGVDKTKINANAVIQVHDSDIKASVAKAKIDAVVRVHESDNKTGVAKINADAAVQMHESNNKADVNKSKINANAAVQMNKSDNKAGVAEAKIDANTALNNTAGTNTMMTLKVIVAKLSKGVVSDKSNIGENSMTVANANRRGLPHRPKRGRENDLCKSCNSAMLINDWSQGDRVCTNCGVVDQAHLMIH